MKPSTSDVGTYFIVITLTDNHPTNPLTSHYPIKIEVARRKYTKPDVQQPLLGDKIIVDENLTFKIDQIDYEQNCVISFSKVIKPLDVDKIKDTFKIFIKTDKTT